MRIALLVLLSIIICGNLFGVHDGQHSALSDAVRTKYCS